MKMISLWLIILSYCYYWNLVISIERSCENIGCTKERNLNNDATCQCDKQCMERKDCCLDYESICWSCAVVGCQSYNSNRGCQCNKECVNHKDCCSDYESTCDRGETLEECAKSPLYAQDRRTDKSKLRVMEYNAQWLFTNYSHSMGSIVCPGNCDWNNNSIAFQHMQTVAQYIAEFNADIIILTEVSDCWVLTQLINHMGNIGQLYKPYLKLGIDTVTGQNVALLTKIDPIEDLTRSAELYSYPISGSLCGYKKGQSNASSSKHFKTRFHITCSNSNSHLSSSSSSSFYLSLFAVHFIAYPTKTDRCAKREAQAWIIRKFANEAIKNGDQIIIAGDFNDFDNEAIGTDGAKTKSQVFKILREMTVPNLKNVNSQIENVTERYSNWHDKNGNCKDDGARERSLIDHILVTNDLFSSLQSIQVAHTYSSACNSLYSDHFPLIADFDLHAMINYKNN